jgi:hypothetical protein
VYHYQSGSKRLSIEWKHTIAKTNKFKSVPSAGKVMLVLFWGFNGAHPRALPGLRTEGQ